MTEFWGVFVTAVSCGDAVLGRARAKINGCRLRYSSVLRTAASIPGPWRTVPKVDQADAYEAVSELAEWSPWRPFSETAATAPRTPGVYLFRLPDTAEIVYVGMAGERGSGGVGKGLRGRLAIYARGRGAVSGFGEAALDRALGNEAWLEDQLASLREHGPKRAKVWAQEAVAFLAPEVCWAECPDKNAALALEKQVETLLGLHGLWNRASEKLRAQQAAIPSEAPIAASSKNTSRPAATADTSGVADDTTFSMRGYLIDLDVLYREMYRYSTAIEGQRVFNGLAKDTPAVKRLLHDLFDVPVADKMLPVNNAIRSECRDRLEAVGWASKGAGRSASYVLHRSL